MESKPNIGRKCRKELTDIVSREREGKMEGWVGGWKGEWAVRRG